MDFLLPGRRGSRGDQDARRRPRPSARLAGPTSRGSLAGCLTLTTDLVRHLAPQPLGRAVQVDLAPAVAVLHDGRVGDETADSCLPRKRADYIPS